MWIDKLSEKHFWIILWKKFSELQDIIDKQLNKIEKTNEQNKKFTKKKKKL